MLGARIQNFKFHDVKREIVSILVINLNYGKFGQAINIKEKIDILKSELAKATEVY